jgi:hypothetical protein
MRNHGGPAVNNNQLMENNMNKDQLFSRIKASAPVRIGKAPTLKSVTDLISEEMKVSLVEAFIADPRKVEKGGKPMIGNIIMTAVRKYDTWDNVKNESWYPLFQHYRPDILIPIYKAQGVEVLGWIQDRYNLLYPAGEYSTLPKAKKTELIKAKPNKA